MYTIFGFANPEGVYHFRTHYPCRRFWGSGGEASPPRRGVWGAAGPPMISAVRAGLVFTSQLNRLTSGLQFKLGLPGYGYIFTSGFARLRFPGYVPFTIHWPVRLFLNYKRCSTVTGAQEQCNFLVFRRWVSERFVLVGEQWIVIP